MIKNGEFFMIKEMKQRGMSITQIANELNRDPKTIRKWLKEGEPGTYKRTVERTSKLDPYKDYIIGRMKEGCTNSAVIFDEIKAIGYTGKNTILRCFMQPHRPTVAAKATERFETPPGRQAQVDWGHFKVDWMGKKKRIYAFVMVLCHSRMIYVEFTEDEKLETLLGCHTRAMEYFGGITETCLYDNMRTVVTGVDERGEVIWNEQFAAFASHHGFIPRRCRPYRARTKGKVENGVKYVRRNFWPRINSFTGIHDLNDQVMSWINTVANKRIHGTTHEIPEERWSKEKLKRPNPISFETAFRHRRKVANDLYLSYQANRYSVPMQYVGHTVKVQDEKNGIIYIYDQEGNLITGHTKSAGKHQLVKDKKHFENVRKINGKTVAQPMPKLIPLAIPEVIERSLSVYDEFSDEAVNT